MQMIGCSLKNYLKCLAYIFVPLGCIFLGFLFGVELFLNELSSQADYMTEELARLFPERGEEFDLLVGYVVASARRLDWNNGMGAFSSLMDGAWLNARITEFLQETAASPVGAEAEIALISATISSALSLDFAMLLLSMALGVVVGYFIANAFVRRRTVKRGFWGMWLAAFVDALLTVSLIAFVTWLLAVSQAGAVVSGIVGALVFGFVSLFEAYLLHGRGKLAFFSVVNLKNCLFVYLSQLAVLAAASLLSAVCLGAIGSMIGVVLVLSVIVIALLVINVNAEAYVDGLVRATPMRLRRQAMFAGLDSVPEYLREEAGLEKSLSEKSKE